jgi:hypothetical protein
MKSNFFSLLLITIPFIFYSCSEAILIAPSHNQLSEECYQYTERYIPGYSLTRFENEIKSLEKNDTLKVFIKSSNQ